MSKIFHSIPAGVPTFPMVSQSSYRDAGTKFSVSSTCHCWADPPTLKMGQVDSASRQSPHGSNLTGLGTHTVKRPGRCPDSVLLEYDHRATLGGEDDQQRARQCVVGFLH